MLKSICKTGADKAQQDFANSDTHLDQYQKYAHNYYLKCLDKDTNRNEFKDINDIKYKYDKIKQQKIDSDLRKKSNELLNYLIVFFIILFFIIIFTIIKFLIIDFFVFLFYNYIYNFIFYFMIIFTNFYFYL